MPDTNIVRAVHNGSNSQKAANDLFNEMTKRQYSYKNARLTVKNRSLRRQFQSSKNRLHLTRSCAERPQPPPRPRNDDSVTRCKHSAESGDAHMMTCHPDIRPSRNIWTLPQHSACFAVKTMHGDLCNYSARKRPNAQYACPNESRVPFWSSYPRKALLALCIQAENLYNLVVADAVSAFNPNACISGGISTLAQHR